MMELVISIAALAFFIGLSVGVLLAAVVIHQATRDSCQGYSPDEPFDSRGMK